MKSNIKDRLDKKLGMEYSAHPMFPRAMNVELSNVCNHACEFCAYPLMERQHGSIDRVKLEGWLREAFLLGVRELGLHSGAEPFASNDLAHFVRYGKSIGYEYIYISTNGSLASPKRMREVIDAGIDSIKFSINAGDRETYLKIHGKDQFDLVLANLMYALDYRGANKKPYIAISAVVTDANSDSVPKLKELMSDRVDEIIEIAASNQSGQLPSEGLRAKEPKEMCPVPFTRLHITWEGFLRGCCNDYENMLALEDLNAMSIEQAFYGARAEKWRMQHLENKLEGTLCYNCIHDCSAPVQPVNPDLYFRTHETDKGPPVSNSVIIHRKVSV